MLKGKQTKVDELGRKSPPGGQLEIEREKTITFHEAKCLPNTIVGE